MSYRKGAHTIYDLKYHVIWCTKYCYRVLTGETANRVRELIRAVCRANYVDILSGSLSPDYIHLLISVPPSITDISTPSNSRKTQILTARGIEGKSAWKDLKSIALVERICVQKGVETKEQRYYISSLSADPRKILSASKAHWGIEKQLHWSLDVTFQEDKRIIWNQNFARNEPIIRRVGLNMLKNFQKTFDNCGRKSKVALKSLRKILIGSDIERLLYGTA